MVSSSTSSLLLQCVLFPPQGAHLLWLQIAPAQLVREHPSFRGVQVRQGEQRYRIRKVVLLADTEAVVPIENDVLLLPDNQRIDTAIDLDICR
jgi:hypothetical protein